MKFDKTKKNVAVFFGGKSVEHDISIITGVQVLNNLDKNRFNVLPIYVHKSGKWLFDESFFNIQTFAKSQDFCFAKELVFCTNTNQLFVKKSSGESLAKCGLFCYILIIVFASLAQLDRVFGFEPNGWGFDSLTTHQNNE